MQTKAKVLNAIAEEHNIKWDSKSFEEKESKPAEDLLVRNQCKNGHSFVYSHWFCGVWMVLQFYWDSTKPDDLIYGKIKRL